MLNINVDFRDFPYKMYNKFSFYSIVVQTVVLLLLLPFTISFPMNRINKDNVVFQICLLIFRGEWRRVAQ